MTEFDAERPSCWASIIMLGLVVGAFLVAAFGGL